MHSAYNPWLVSLSIGVAIMVSFTSLRLASRVAEAHASASRAWLILGSISMGTGIWAMHFIGMLAFSLPIQLRYSIALTFVSLAVAILTSGFAIRIASSKTLGFARHCACSLVMGSGIVVMHYTGMSAIQIFPMISYDPLLVAASVLVAVLASFAALWLTFNLRSGAHRFIWAARLGAAVIMGMAIAGMHYTAMSAAEFQAGSFCAGGIALDNTWLATSVALAALALMAITLITVVFDGHLASRARLHSQWLQRLNSQLLHREAHDSLTDLPSRGLFIDRLEQAIAQRSASAESDVLLTVMLIDLDRFSIVNDSLGHGSGDAILLEVTRRLKALAASTDFVARLGGDEFLVLTRETQVRDVALLAGRIVQCLGKPYSYGSAELHLAASVGITTYPFDDAKPEVLISHADEAMHEIKADGGGGYRFFVPGTAAFSMERLQLENDLRKAPGNGELELHYQPQVDIASARTIGFEALVRWRHPERGMIPPGEFIPLAEASDLIVHIGKWIMDEACRQMRAWCDEGFGSISVAINLSARQFRQPNLLETIQQTVANSGLLPRHIVIELTESAVMSDADRSVAILEELHRSGFQVAVDDFGTGYSSMNYLKRLPVSKLKIDQSFVSELGLSKKTDAIVKAVVQLAHGLDLIVVAEGVETEAQLRCLKALDCDQYQGYLYSRPLTAEHTTELLRRAFATPREAHGDEQQLASGT